MLKNPEQLRADRSADDVAMAALRQSAGKLSQLIATSPLVTSRARS